MWCSACQQHVAAVVGDSGECTLCAVCGAEIDVFADLATLGATASQATARRAVKPSHEPALPHLSHSRARLDHIGRRLEALGNHSPTSRKRIDSPRTAPPSKPTSSPSRVTGAGLFLGVTALVCGVSLAAWSLATDRAELWNIGLPTALLGQFLLLATLAAHCEFWRSAPSSSPPA